MKLINQFEIAPLRCHKEMQPTSRKGFNGDAQQEENVLVYIDDSKVN